LIDSFLLHQPESLSDALTLLAEHSNEVKVLAGGSELILLLKMGLLAAKHIINLKKIPDLASLDYESSPRFLHIGPLVTHRALEKSEILHKYFPLLVEMEKQLANVRIRNVGTLAGNLAFAEPHADPGTLLVAYEASVTLTSVDGERTLSLEDFFIDFYETALASNEILSEISIPKPAASSKGAYLRFCPGERPMVGVALLSEWNEEICEKPRLVLGCVGPKPMRALELEDWMTGRSREDIQAEADSLGTKAAMSCQPLEDISGSVEYKRQIVKTLVARAILRLTHERIDHG